MYSTPTIQAFKDYFQRDFPFGTDINTSITDNDITKAYIYVELNMNMYLWPSEQIYQLAFLLYAAHVLTINIQNSSQGVSGAFQWPAASKSVGSVSVSAQIPDQILRNPIYSYFTKTNYGAEYLMMLLPYLVGPMTVVPGKTWA